MLGFQHRSIISLPTWSYKLSNLYYIIRVEGRDTSKRRKAYRDIQKEKLRLVEAGIDVLDVVAVCKYLVSLKQINADRLKRSITRDKKQLTLDLFH